MTGNPDPGPASSTATRRPATRTSCGGGHTARPYRHRADTGQARENDLLLKYECTTLPTPSREHAVQRPGEAPKLKMLPNSGRKLGRGIALERSDSGQAWHRQCHDEVPGDLKDARSIHERAEAASRGPAAWRRASIATYTGSGQLRKNFPIKRGQAWR